jgi:hypothetical protein
MIGSGSLVCLSCRHISGSLQTESPATVLSLMQRSLPAAFPSRYLVARMTIHGTTVLQSDFVWRIDSIHAASPVCQSSKRLLAITMPKTRCLRSYRCRLPTLIDRRAARTGLQSSFGGGAILSLQGPCTMFKTGLVCA